VTCCSDCERNRSWKVHRLEAAVHRRGRCGRWEGSVPVTSATMWTDPAPVLLLCGVGIWLAMHVRWCNANEKCMGCTAGLDSVACAFGYPAQSQLTVSSDFQWSYAVDAASPPVLFDTNGDGVMEYVVGLRNPPRIQVLRDESQVSLNVSAPLTVQHEIRLSRSKGLAQGRIPVKIGVGDTAFGAVRILCGLRVSVSVCKMWVLFQVIVVVTDAWNVLVFRSTLELLWESKASHLEERYGSQELHLVHKCA
jgi:hypothetical protein